MKRLNWLFAAAGMAALAACGGDRDEMNAVNDMNAMETLPADNSFDMNTGMTNDVANDMNAMNTADNAVTNNSY